MTVSRAEQAVIAERRARVLQYRVEHVPYAEIAARLGVSESTAEKDYQRAVEGRRDALDSVRTTAVAIELAKLDALEREAWRVLKARHITVQHGKIVRDENDEPIEDDAPVLQAIDRIIKVSERRARLRGLDAPVKVDVSDERRAEIEKYAAELAAWVGDVDEGGAGDAPGEAEAGAGEDSPA